MNQDHCLVHHVIVLYTNRYYSLHLCENEQWLTSSLVTTRLTVIGQNG